MDVCLLLLTMSSLPKMDFFLSTELSFFTVFSYVLNCSSFIFDEFLFEDTIFSVFEIVWLCGWVWVFITGGGGRRLLGGGECGDTFWVPVFIIVGVFEIVVGGGRLLMFGIVGGGKVGGGGKFPNFGGGGKFGRDGGGGKLEKIGSVGGGNSPMLGKVGGGGKPPTGIFRIGGGDKLVAVLPVIGLLPKLRFAQSKAFAFFIPSGLPLIYYLGLVGVYLGVFCLKRLAQRFFLAQENAALDGLSILFYTLGSGFVGQSSYSPISFLLFFIIASRSRFILNKTMRIIMQMKYQDRINQRKRVISKGFENQY